jgi:hypothetical protein
MGRPKKSPVSGPVFSGKTAEAAMQKFNVSRSAIDEARRLLLNGNENIVKMVATGKIGTTAARQGIRGATKEEIAAMSVGDVLQRSRMVKADQKKQRDADPKPEQPKPRKDKPPAFINPPYGQLKPMPKEDFGSPPPGASLAEIDAHHERYGRVQLHPKLVKDQMINRSGVQATTTAIMRVAGTDQLEAEAFFAAIDEMLAWKPRRNGENGWAIEFAQDARKHLDLLDDVLDKAAQRLNALQAMRNARRSDGQSPAVCIGSAVPAPAPRPADPARYRHGAGGKLLLLDNGNP